MKLLRSAYAIILAAVLLPGGLVSPSFGYVYEGVKVSQIARASTAANGQRLEYLRTGDAEVTALLVEIPPGGETGWHLHPVPVYAYILSGSIDVEMADGKDYVFREGDVIFEVMNTPHNGKTVGDKPARLVVFYTGEAGKPTTVKVPPDK